MSVHGRQRAEGTFGGLVGVIGASRGTGLQCVLYLARRKIACRAIARNPAACEKAVTAALPPALHKLVAYCKADVTDEKTLEPAVRGCDGVIFAATATAGWTLFESKDTPPSVDFEGSVASATAAAGCGVRHFVLISSLAVTRPSNVMHMTRNSLMGRIMDWKLLGEQGVCKVYDKFSRTSTTEMSVTIVRPGLLTDDPPAGPGSLLGESAGPASYPSRVLIGPAVCLAAGRRRARSVCAGPIRRPL
jgi:NAD(P)-dependent dehydrogenase (short-subunit alcohol dehydrogenase family)